MESMTKSAGQHGVMIEPPMDNIFHQAVETEAGEQQQASFDHPWPFSHAGCVDEKPPGIITSSNMPAQ